MCVSMAFAFERLLCPFPFCHQKKLHEKEAVIPSHLLRLKNGGFFFNSLVLLSYRNAMGRDMLFFCWFVFSVCVVCLLWVGGRWAIGSGGGGGCFVLIVAL